MKISTLKTAAIVMASSLIFASCKKNVDVGIQSTGNFTETGIALKDAADFPIGVAAGLNLMKTVPQYADIVKRDYDLVTFENELKNSSVVSASGVFNYTTADEFVNLATAAGLGVHGHTLAWHSQQASGYYNLYAGILQPATVELLPNSGFELGTTNLQNWSTYNSNGAVVSIGAGANEVRTGTRSLKVVNSVPHPGGQYQVQVASDLFNTDAGKSYVISYWVKAATAGGSIRLSTGPTAQYQGDQTIGSTFQQVSWTIVANSTQTRILFDMGLLANTYYIDDASVKEVVAAPSGNSIALKVDTALRTFITTTVDRYKGRIKSWDVVNEMFTESGDIRNNTNTAAGANIFVWSNYLGRDFGFKAFSYAAAADPAAQLYINDYNLENAGPKLDSLIKYVAEIKARGAKVDGIGTQMHISWNSNYSNIDLMFQKLAATGLKIKVSELDVKTVLTSAAAAPTPELNAYQAVMYKFVVSSYMKNIPKAQQGGITVWGVNDANSWLYNAGREFTLLYDNSFMKKPSYAGFLQGLQGK